MVPNDLASLHEAQVSLRPRQHMPLMVGEFLNECNNALRSDGSSSSSVLIVVDPLTNSTLMCG